MEQPVYIEDILESVVAKVSEKLLPQLKQHDSNITAVHFDYGHPLEVIETLSEKTNEGGDFVYQKYPLVMLVFDIKARRGNEIGVFAEYDLHIVIVTGTTPTDKLKQRMSKNFIPVLTPIYNEFLNQLKASKAFSILDVSKIDHRPSRRPYWGRTGLWGNEGNIFNDWVDCIEIENLKLKLNINYCLNQAI